MADTQKEYLEFIEHDYGSGFLAEVKAELVSNPVPADAAVSGKVYGHIRGIVDAIHLRHLKPDDFAPDKAAEAEVSPAAKRTPRFEMPETPTRMKRKFVADVLRRCGKEMTRDFLAELKSKPMPAETNMIYFHLQQILRKLELKGYVPAHCGRTNSDSDIRMVI